MWWDLIVAAPVPPPDSITSEYSVPCTRSARRAPSPPASFAASSSNTLMNSAPIALRLASGSVTPFSFSRNRSSASTATSGTLNVSLNALTTCSPSSLRISPWSTNTHVSWSPTARCTSSAATDESTPPDSPQITCPSPTCRADPRDLILHDPAADQVRSQPHTSVRNLVRISCP